MLYALIVVIGLLSGAYYALASAYTDQIESMKAEHGDVDPVTKRFIASPGSYASIGGYPDASSLNTQKKADEVETALIRTCRTISTQAHANGCANWNASTAMWSFVGVAGGTGSIDSLWGASDSTLLADCSNIDRYGKFIFTKSVNRDLGMGKGLRYNLAGVSDANTDPCGYDNIVGR